MRHPGNRIVGSNPTLSATQSVGIRTPDTVRLKTALWSRQPLHAPLERRFRWISKAIAAAPPKADASLEIDAFRSMVALYSRMSDDCVLTHCLPVIGGCASE